MIKPPPMSMHTYAIHYAAALVASIGLAACATQPSTKPPLTAPSPQSSHRLQAPPPPVARQHPDLGHDHIPLPAFPHAPYNSNPPSSGAHTGYTAPWGNHQAPVANEVLLHNLEHGGVVIGYRCKHCPDLVAELVALAGDYSLIIIAPNPTLDSRIGLSAWAHTLVFDNLDDGAKQAVAKFIALHHGVDHHPPTAHGHTAAPQERSGH